MRNGRTANGGVRQCPCYPYCDVMMESRAETGMDMGMKPMAGMKSTTQASANAESQPGWTEVSDYAAGLNSAPAERLEWIQKNEADWQKQKDAYPDMVKRVQSEVERVCDQMEYEGSMMFDETPDRDGIYRMAFEIEQTLLPELEQWERTEAEKGQEDVYAMSRTFYGKLPAQSNPAEPCPACGQISVQSGSGGNRPSYGQPPAQPGSGGNRPPYGQPPAQPGSGGNRPPYGQPPAQPGSSGNRPPYGQPPMPPAPPEPGRPPGHNWFGDLVNVMLRQEMYHRRCRNRSCRG